jgi:hypothetical protein
MILPLFGMNQLAARWWWGRPRNTLCFACWKGKNKTGGEVKKLPGGGMGLAPDGPLLRQSTKRTRRSGSSRTRATAPTDPGTESGVFEVFFYIWGVHAVRLTHARACNSHILKEYFYSDPPPWNF